MKSKRWVSQVAGIIAFAIAFAFGKSLFPPISLQSAVANASNEINKTTPITIDNVTKLTTTSTSGNELHYHYEVSPTITLTQAELDQSVKKGIVNSDCTADATRRLLNRGGILVYDYYDSKGSFIRDGFRANPSSNCGR